jgi:hypothetical protein
MSRVLAPRTIALLATVGLLTGLLVSTAGSPVEATPVADADETYAAFGRVFPDPHGCLDGSIPTASPHAKGNVCAVQFIQWGEALAGLAYLEERFGRYVELINLAEEDFNDSELSDEDFRSAGIAREDLSRDQRDLYVVKVTDHASTVPESQREHFVYSLAIHGIERAGLEGGLRAVEDLATWAACENGDAPEMVDCESELDGQDARRLLDPFDDEGRSPTAGEALGNGVLLFTLSNPDGWVRGDYSEGGVFYQRFNGHGMDLNRDWPTVGYSDSSYESWSEPETRGFGRWLEHVAQENIAPDEDGNRGHFAGGIDLHGMVTANSLSYTLLGAGQKDYRKNAISVDTASLMWADAEERLTWSPHVARQEDCPGPVPEPFFGEGRTQGPMCTVQWGTVWDTIEYQITGGMGDWIDNPDVGLGGVGINNEMALSHLAPNNIFDPGIVQLQVEGNKSLIYSQVTALLGDDTATYEPGGRIAYVDDESRVSSDGESLVVDPDVAALDPQEPIEGIEVTGGQGFEFEVLGHEGDGIHNPGMTVAATFTNVRGIGGYSVSTLILDYCGPGVDADGNPREMALTHQHAHEHDVRASLHGHTAGAAERAHHLHERVAPSALHPDQERDLQRWGAPTSVQSAYGFGEDDEGDVECEEVARHHSQGPIYADAGAQIALNHPQPGIYQVRANPARVGATRYEVTFGDDEAIPGWDEQAPYDVSRTDFFEELNEYVDGEELVRVTVEQVLDDPRVLDAFDSLVVADRFMPEPVERDEQGEPVTDQDGAVVTASYDAEQQTAYAAALRSFAASGGNLVLTDGALAGLGALVAELDETVSRGVFYAGYIDFNDGEQPTFDVHPMTENLQQDGTASGRQTLDGEQYHDRRQTYEPVPVGYLVGAPASCTSGCDAPVWVVDEDAWAAAGGTHLGRSFVRGGPNDSTGWDGVSLGELELGDGVVRVIGALLPEPTQDNFHPYGLAAYGLTYTGYQLFENATTWDRGLSDPEPGEVTVSCEDCELEIRAGESAQAELQVANDGDQDVALAAHVPDGWGADVDPAVVAAGKTVTVELTLDTPRNARGTHDVEVVASAGDAAVASDTVTVEVVKGRPSDPGNGQTRDGNPGEGNGRPGGTAATLAGVEGTGGAALGLGALLLALAAALSTRVRRRARS